MQLVLIERTLGGYVVSKAVEYWTYKSVEYCPLHLGVNIFGQKLSELFTKKVETIQVKEIRFKAGSALSCSFKDEAKAIAWAEQNGLAIFKGQLHVAQ